MNHQPETKAIEIIERCSTNPPPNEQATCLWVIMPVLQALGYALTEILPQPTDAAGQRPDYEILPDTEHAWYLEAKTWSTELSDYHVNQALNYANQNGRRWVVLSNGREWRLYDNSVQSDAQGKLVARGDRENQHELRRVLAAVSCDSVTSNSIDQFARSCRLEKAVIQGLQDANGLLTRAIAGALRESAEGFGEVTTEEVHGIIKRWLEVRRSRFPLGSSSASPSPRVSPEAASPQSTRELLGLRQVMDGVIVTHRSPIELLCPGTAPIRVRKWRDVMISVLSHVAAQGVLQVPYKEARRGHRYLVNSAPVHEDGEQMIHWAELRHHGMTYYVDVNRSASNIVSALVRLCLDVGLNPDEYKLRIS